MEPANQRVLELACQLVIPPSILAKAPKSNWTAHVKDQNGKHAHSHLPLSFILSHCLFFFHLCSGFIFSKLLYQSQMCYTALDQESPFLFQWKNVLVQNSSLLSFFCLCLGNWCCKNRCNISKNICLQCVEGVTDTQSWVFGFDFNVCLCVF